MKHIVKYFGTIESADFCPDDFHAKYHGYSRVTFLVRNYDLEVIAGKYLITNDYQEQEKEETL